MNAAGGVQPFHSAEYFPGAGGYSGGNQLSHVVGQLHFQPSCKMVRQTETRWSIGQFHLANHAACQASGQFGPQLDQVCRRSVGGERQLGTVADQRIDRVQQFDECGPFAGEKLQIVDHQQIDSPVLAAKVRQAVAAQCFDKIRGELLGRQEHAIGRAALTPGGRANSLEQMGFTGTWWTIHEKRIQRAQSFGHHLCGSMRQSIAATDHKVLQCGKTASRDEFRSCRSGDHFGFWPCWQERRNGATRGQLGYRGIGQCRRKK